MSDLQGLSNEELKTKFVNASLILSEDRKLNQLRWYQPASPKIFDVHACQDGIIGVSGGNGSSKTESQLVEIISLATGIFPYSIADHIRPKFRGPISCRVVCESLTTVLRPVILPKMQWWKWTGVDQAGEERGHWGWIPRYCLKEEDWKASWSEQFRTLTVLCRDPDDINHVVGESTFQFMSHDQDPSDFASGDFHEVLLDEPPKYAIWTENEARTMRVRGRKRLAMTFPDDPSMPVDWIFDEIYEPARMGRPGTSWFELDTRQNVYLDQDAVAAQMKTWSKSMINVRIKGQPIRFSNRVHPLFTDYDSDWCFSCNESCATINGCCSICGSTEICSYNHVKDFDIEKYWPVVWVIDPHPRKPHMFCWIAIDPKDDLWMLAEGEVDGDPTDVRRYCEDVEEDFGIKVSQRLIDPNMGRSPASARRNITWIDEFDRAGIVCDEADDADVGRSRFNEYLRPDRRSYEPRFHIHSRCRNAIQQIKRYVWDDHRRSLEKDLKQIPKAKYDDYPTMIKYLLNTDPQFRFLREGWQVQNRWMDTPTNPFGEQDRWKASVYQHRNREL